MHHLNRLTLACLAVMPLAASAEPLFPSSQYGSLDLMLPQSIVNLESILSGHESFERIADYAPTDRIRMLARPVGRLDVELSVGGVSTCTASLLPGGYILTNHHCIPGDGAHGQVLKASVVMGYIEEGDASGTERFAVETRPVETNADLDYSIVKVVGSDPSTRWGNIRIEARDPVPGEALMIVHHPAGRPQHVTRGGCRAKTTGPVSGNDILHKCDTLGGSSGSPIFSDSTGLVVALHYAGSLSPSGDMYNSGKRMSMIAGQSALLKKLGVIGEAPPGQTPPPPVPQAPTPAPAKVPAADVVARIRALPNGGSDAWDAEVAKVLVGAFDQNRSGNIDFASEVAAVPCEVWAAIDAGVRVQWPTGLYSTYGFQGGASWEATGMGLSADIKWDAARALTACGITNSGDATAPSSPVPTPPPAAPVAARDPRAALRALPAADWDAGAATALIGAYDADRSGALDTTSEIGAVPCDVWKLIDDKVRAEWSHPLDTVYGFAPNLIWVGSLIGVQERARQPAHDALVRCGLTSSGGTEARTAASSADTQSAFERLMRIPFNDTYNAQARVVMLETFDVNRSGAIESVGELSAVDCRVWRAIDQSFRARFNGSGVGRIQGFAPDFLWVGSLGIDASMRSAGWAAIQRCGLDR
jgi:V8-like Glu-specific endopeptidase